MVQLGWKASEENAWMLGVPAASSLTCCWSGQDALGPTGSPVKLEGVG